MWRAFFMAIAITLCILGLECLLVEKAVLARTVPPDVIGAASYNYWDASFGGIDPKPVHKVVTPPEWAPWSLISGGVVVMLYAMSLRKPSAE